MAAPLPPPPSTDPQDQAAADPEQAAEEVMQVPAPGRFMQLHSLSTATLNGQVVEVLGAASAPVQGRFPVRLLASDPPRDMAVKADLSSIVG